MKKHLKTLIAALAVACGMAACSGSQDTTYNDSTMKQQDTATAGAASSGNGAGKDSVHVDTLQKDSTSNH